MTKIDRYILILFLRTVFICFCSIAGIFIVFHAFGNMDHLVRQGKATEGGLAMVVIKYYAPYMLLLWDWTGAIITLMALLFTVGWLRRTGELTATLAAGISHGRILKPMVIASLFIIGSQLINREFIIPQYRDALSLKANAIDAEYEQAISPSYDLTSGILIEGRALMARSRELLQPNFRLDGDYPGFGDLLFARSAVWQDATSTRSSGYLLSDVQRPQEVHLIVSAGMNDRPILLTAHDHDWLQPNQCFVATTIHPDLLQTNRSANRMAPITEIADRIRNPAVFSGPGLSVVLHERMLRAPLDFSLVLLGLPLVINRRGRNLFVMIGAAVGTVLMFFVLKMAASAMGGSEFLFSPAMAAWAPLLILGPIAYVRYCDAQVV